MGSLVRAMLSALSVLAVAGFTVGQAVADDGDGYYPSTLDPKTGPAWERPKFTEFQVMRCNVRGLTVDRLVINRDDVAAMTGFATYTDSAKDKGYQQGAGGWQLAGDQLKVSGDGFELEGRWIGPFLTATITRESGGEPVRCRFQVTALRSFTEYQ